MKKRSEPVVLCESVVSRTLARVFEVSTFAWRLRRRPSEELLLAKLGAHCVITDKVRLQRGRPRLGQWGARPKP